MGKKILCLIIASVMLVGLLPAYALNLNGVYETPVVKTGTMIEFEEGYIENDDVIIKKVATASGRKVTTARYGSLAKDLYELAGTYTPDISFIVDIPEDGEYTLYMRTAVATIHDRNFWYRIDGEPGVDKYTCGIVDNQINEWNWTKAKNNETKQTITVYFTKGEHKIEFLRRAANIWLDVFMISADPDLDLEELESKSLENAHIKIPDFITNSTAVNINLNNGYGVLEAESATIDYGLYNTANSTNASNNKYIIPRAVNTVQPTIEQWGLEFNFTADVAAEVYQIWGRVCSPDTSHDSAFGSVDGEVYQICSGFSKTGNDVFEWRVIATVEDVLAGSKHNFRLYPREKTQIDKFIIIPKNIKMQPTGKDGVLESIKELPSDQYPLPTVFPPEGQHPRLLFTANDISKIKENMDKPQNAAAKAHFEEVLARDEDGDLGTSVLEGYANYDKEVVETIEAYAFKYAIDNDYTYGQKAKTAIMNYLDTISFSTDILDATRSIGESVYIASQVYDWCYDLFSEEEREHIIEHCEEMASIMEIGYPPKGQSSVNGHGGEQQLFKDLLGFSIATYDERPDIYNYVAGRFFSEYVPARNYLYNSSMHNQGVSYGPVRYLWETYAQMMIARMTNGEVRAFNDTHADVLYSWIYQRRGDGAMLKMGDTSVGAYGYASTHRVQLLLASNFYGDKVLKGEYDLQNAKPDFYGGYDARSAVISLLFNDPDLEGQSKNDLPLSRYFGTPMGTMIARTGWDVNTDNPSQNDDVVAMMHIGERWGGDHQHLDAGSFQIYYKGMLAIDSGDYEYAGTYHHNNYVRQSIAHNVLTILDPLEVTNTYSGQDNFGQKVENLNTNDGGQRRPNNDSIVTLDGWLADEHEIGVVLDQGFGPDEKTPAYTYIKGDIAKAYGGRTVSGVVQPKVSEVKRSMAFMPLDDENYKAIMVVMDKVTSTDANFKKKWIIHTEYKPDIDGNTTTIINDRAELVCKACMSRYEDGDTMCPNCNKVLDANDIAQYNGKLTLQTLLPQAAAITRVGGEGKEFAIQDVFGDGQNINFGYQTVHTEDTKAITGWGRVEISPRTNALEDKFLNVMAVSDADNDAQPLDSQLIEGTNLVGVLTADKVLMFGDTDTSNDLKNRVSAPSSFTIPDVEGELDIMIAGMKSGIWSISDGNVTKQVIAGEDDGVLYFEGEAGTYELEYVKDVSDMLLINLAYSTTGTDATSGTVTGYTAGSNGGTYVVSVPRGTTSVSVSPVAYNASTVTLPDPSALSANIVNGKAVIVVDASGIVDGENVSNRFTIRFEEAAPTVTLTGADADDKAALTLGVLPDGDGVKLYNKPLWIGPRPSGEGLYLGSDYWYAFATTQYTNSSYLLAQHATYSGEYDEGHMSKFGKAYYADGEGGYTKDYLYSFVAAEPGVIALYSGNAIPDAEKYGYRLVFSENSDMYDYIEPHIASGKYDDQLVTDNTNKYVLSYQNAADASAYEEVADYETGVTNVKPGVYGSSTNTYLYVYTKPFAADEKVVLPFASDTSIGDSKMYVPLVQWRTPSTETGYTLAWNDGESDFDVEADVNAIEVPYGATANFTATTTSEDAYVKYSWTDSNDVVHNDKLVTSFPTTMKITVYAEDNTFVEREIALTMGAEKRNFSLDLQGFGVMTYKVGEGEAVSVTESTSAIALDKNSTITLAAIADEGHAFAYWVDGVSGRVISEEAVYTFDLVASKKVKAVFVPNAEGTKTYVFRNVNGCVLLDGYLAEGQFITPPANPTQMGYIFSEWQDVNKKVVDFGAVGEEKIGYSDLADGLNVFFAKFELDPNAIYTLTLPADAKLVSPKDAGEPINLAYNEIVKVRAADKEGFEFKCWREGGAEGTIVSYRPDYGFYMSRNITLYAEYVDAGETVNKEPIVSIAATYLEEGGDKKIAFFAERDLLAAETSFELLETGILITNDAEKNIDLNERGLLKSTSTRKTDKGQYLAKKLIEDSNTWYAKAYVVYKDLSGNIYELYSDKLTATYSAE